MGKHLLAAFVVTASVGLLSGCETTKQTAKGFSHGLHDDVSNTAGNCKDAAVGTYDAVVKADKWMQQNMW